MLHVKIDVSCLSTNELKPVFVQWSFLTRQFHIIVCWGVPKPHSATPLIKGLNRSPNDDPVEVIECHGQSHKPAINVGLPAKILTYFDKPGRDDGSQWAKGDDPLADDRLLLIDAGIRFDRWAILPNYAELIWNAENLGE